MGINRILAALTFVTAASSGALAEDFYFHIPFRALQITEGKLPIDSHAPSERWQLLPAMNPYAVLDGGGEVYIGGDSLQPWVSGLSFYDSATVVIRASTNHVTGRLFVPNEDVTGMVAVRFSVRPEQSRPDSKQEFARARETHYRRLQQRNIPGSAWFRQQAGTVSQADTFQPWNRRRGPQFNDVEDTFELFSGGRAISENLQLDRVLRMGSSNRATVPISNITGITIREMNWKPLLANARPQHDPLARYIPADQHAIFFPGFAAMTALLDEADTGGTPVLQFLEPRSEDALTRTKYQKQLCLDLDDLSRMVGPHVISSVALTGSDPYLRTGTDVGVLFEVKSPALLKTFIAAKHAALQQGDKRVQAVSGTAEGVAYTGVVASDRSISSYLAALDDAVLVSNSRQQLTFMIEAAKGKRAALSALDEYAFFRSRYSREEKEESALVILTDAAIRRWCGPQWRIGNSRRTRAAAALADAQASSLNSLVHGTPKAGAVQTRFSASDAGEIQVTTNGVISSVYGTLDFLTPIAELPMTMVTREEAEAYERWRDGYQNNWRQFFDPIALRVCSSGAQLKVDLTVMPLIAGSDYRQFIDLTRGAQIAPNAGDRHAEALAHVAMAINPQSELIKMSGNFLGGMNGPLGGSPLGWLGQSISIYADDDPFWEKLRRSKEQEDFLHANYHQLPVALHFEVKNALGVATFLTGLRGFVEQTAPRMTSWQNSDYNGQAYVKVTPTEAAREEDNDIRNLAIYYAVTPKSLVVTLSETLVKRALDRQTARAKAKADDKPYETSARPWLGTNLCLQIDQGILSALEAIGDERYRTAQQVLSWNNIPILNEWKRLYPDHDPLKLHEQFWQTRLICPGGGKYVWNEKWQTMESTVYGHPGEPKPGPENVTPLARFSAGNFGLTFENQGLRATAVLERRAKALTRAAR